MKIAYLSTSRLPSTEANGVHVMRMGAAFASLGHEVRVFGKPGDPSLGDPHNYYGTTGFEVVLDPGLPLRGVAPWVRAARISRGVRSWGVDVAYGRDPHSLLLTGWRGIPFGYEMHQLSSGRRARLEDRLFGASAGRLFVFITGALEADYLREHPGLERRPTLVAADGADLPQARSPQIESQPMTVGYIGQIYAGRGIELIAALAKRLPEVPFRIVGGDRDAAERLLGSNITALDNLQLIGHVPAHQVQDELARCSIALAPYQQGLETARGGDTSAWMSPLKVFEYMANSLPIIASDLPVLREVLRHEHNALLVPPTDVEAWTSAVRRLIGDPELRSRLGRTARADIAEQYSWRRRAERLTSRLEAS